MLVVFMKTISWVRAAIATALFVSFGVLGAAYKVGSDASDYLRTVSTQRQWQGLDAGQEGNPAIWAGVAADMGGSPTGLSEETPGSGADGGPAIGAEKVAVGQRALK